MPGPGDQLGSGALIGSCPERLTHFTCPTSVDVVTALPRNPAGKVLERELREPCWQASDRKIR
ncbi:MAG: hypothetical protein M0Z82_08015 [Actinomycetota bacterium]|nr:hypothetical protein [Actinomycetota bacterium]